MHKIFSLCDLADLTNALDYYISDLPGQLASIAFTEEKKNPDHPLVVLQKEYSLDFYKGDWAQDIEIHHFPQMWGSTSGGWGGIGGAAMSTYYTTLIYQPLYQIIAVFFSGRFAYCMRATGEVRESVLCQHRIRTLPSKVGGDILFITSRK